MSQQVDERIIKKIHALVGEGIRSVEEMERAIKLYVKNEMFHGEALPPHENRRYFPFSRDIRNHMYTATTKLRLSKIDQENLHMKMMEWKKTSPNDSFFFRSYGQVKTESVGVEQLFYNENGDNIAAHEVS